jgi:hypothetical protein
MGSRERVCRPWPVSAFLPDRKCMHFMTITSARRTPGKLIDTRQNLQSIQPTFLETGILFYSTGALSHAPTTCGSILQTRVKSFIFNS